MDGVQIISRRARHDERRADEADDGGMPFALWLPGDEKAVQ
jgi:hypothetical protein